MSRDGSWTDPLERYKALRAHADELEQRAEQAETIVAALVRKYGEQVLRDYSWRVGLTEAELLEPERGLLRIMTDPNSGAMLLRYERPM